MQYFNEQKILDMKKVIITLLMAFICQNILAKEVVLQYTHKVGTQDMVLNTGIYTNAAGVAYKITRADFYMSLMKLIHDGEQATQLSNYVLVKGGQTTFPLGNYELNNLEGFQFSLGVDPEANHSDPSSYPADHPLANQNPDMNWGWSSGYRFIALEGVAADANGNFTVPFEIHVLFDENLMRVFVPTAGSTNGDVLNINITLDYAEMLKNIDLSNTIINHGNGAALDQMLVNIAHNPIFTATVATNVIENTLKGSVMFANPCTQNSIVTYQFANLQLLNAMLCNVQGKVIAQYEQLPTNGTITLPNNLTTGMYLLSFTDEKRQAKSNHKIQLIQ